MISNCGVLGLDWRCTSLSTYIETLEAHNESNDPKASKGPVDAGPGLKRFFDAHRQG